MRGDAGERFCNPCFAQHIRPGVCVDIINADARASLEKVEDENSHVSRNQIVDKSIEMINILTRGNEKELDVRSEKPPIVKWGRKSKFCIDFLFNHFTRKSPKHYIDKCLEGQWKAAIKENLEVFLWVIV